MEIVGDKITISLEEWKTLMEDSDFLECLRSAGVDNWQGFDDAVEMHIENMEKMKNGYENQSYC